MRKLFFILVIMFGLSTLYADVISLVQKAAENVKFPEKVSYITDEEITEYEELGSSDIVGKYYSTKRFEFFENDSFAMELISERYEGDIEQEEDSDDDSGEGSFNLDDPSSPFSLEGMKNYNYSDGGVETVSNHEYRKVIFKAKERSKEFFDGYGLVDENTGEIHKVNVRLAKLPLVLKAFNFTYEFYHENGYTLPSKFDMDISIKIILVVNKTLNIKMKFREYEIKDA